MNTPRTRAQAGASISSTFSLSIHASYGCRDRGACCTAGWPIPIEPAPLKDAEDAIRDGRLRPPSYSVAPFERPPHAPPDAPALVAVNANACVFYHSSGSRRCELHRTLGHAALPLACRQFPRISVHDPRGISITLSHYCPTATDLLSDDTPLAVVENASAFPPDGEYVGLDARDALPPLLRPGMLMDWQAWWAWERESVAVLDDASSAAAGLAGLSAAVEHARTWQPGDGPLLSRVHAAFTRARGSAPALDQQSRADTRDLVAGVIRAIPEELRRQVPGSKASAPGTDRPTTDGVHRRFLAAHAFANWTAHLGHGLRAWLRSVEAADALMRQGNSVGEADLLLRHLADPKALADEFNRAET